MLMKENITINGLTFTPFISAETIRIAVLNIAKQIQCVYAPEDEILVLIVLKGSFIFAADLIRHLHLRCRIEMIRASSYGDGMQSSGEVHLTIPPLDIKGKHILIIEDIIDSGRTLVALHNRLLQKQPASIHIAALLSKPIEHQYDLSKAFVGFEIPSLFVIGYGLDYQELGRELPDIYQLKI